MRVFAVSESFFFFFFRLSGWPLQVGRCLERVDPHLCNSLTTSGSSGCRSHKHGDSDSQNAAVFSVFECGLRGNNAGLVARLVDWEESWEASFFPFGILVDPS